MPRMFGPPHPGLTLRDDVLPALGLNVTEAAAQLGVSRVALSRALNGRAAISPEMVLRIEAWLGVERGGDARVWLAEQTAYDVWHAQLRMKADKVKVKPAPVDSESWATPVGIRKRAIASSAFTSVHTRRVGRTADAPVAGGWPRDVRVPHEA